MSDENQSARDNVLKHAVTSKQVAEKRKLDLGDDYPEPEETETTTKTRAEVHPHTSEEVLKDNIKKGTIDPDRLKEFKQVESEREADQEDGDNV